MRIVVTGASGFVGRHLVNELLEDNVLSLRCIYRNRPTIENERIEYIIIKDFSELNISVFRCVDVVIHLAGLAHITSKNNLPTEQTYYNSNVVNTKKLLKASIDAGVKQFIYLSTANVYGDFSGQILKETSLAKPNSFQASSKLEAEIQIQKACENSNTAFTILRSPLIYSSDAPANFATLISLVKKAKLLPFGAVCNKRSYISITNLTQLMRLILANKLTYNKVYNISDNDDLSTKKLIDLIIKSTRSDTINFYFPVSLLKLLFKMFRKSNLDYKLIRNFQLDVSKIQNDLNWKPNFSAESQLLKIK